MAVKPPFQDFKNPTACASAFGRFFYAVGSVVYFSKVLITAKDAGRCYQINDPVSEDIPDVLDTDGGYILIEDTLNIRAIRPFRSGVLVFAENGVWYVYNSDTGFKATSFNVTKVTERGVVGKRTIVEAEGVMFYFSGTGVVRVVADDFDNLIGQDVTEATIRQHYLDFFYGKNCQGVYHEAQKQVVWWNPDEDSRGLIYDVSIDAFYPQKNFGSKTITRPVKIVNEIFYPSWEASPVFEYSLSQPASEDFKDFAIDQDAYLISGWETLGKFANSKSITQAKVFFNRTEDNITGYASGEYTYDKPSGCLFQSRWDFDTSEDYAKWVGRTSTQGGRGKKINLYNPLQRGLIPSVLPTPFNQGNGVVSKKFNIRGSGDAVQFLFEAQPEKDLQLLGYSVSYTMRGRV